MPIVRIVYKGKANDIDILLRLRDNLRKICAQELSTQKIQLKEDDIQLNFEEGHPFNIGKDLQIAVSANNFPERADDIQERADRIAEKIKPLLISSNGETIHGFVYPLLGEGGLGEF